MDDEENNQLNSLDDNLKYQKKNVYNKLLPHSENVEEEAGAVFQKIKSNICKAVIAREIRPGSTFWTTRLMKYVKLYGFKFTKDDHVALIKLLYELVMIPDLDPTRVMKFSGTLSYLLKKRDLLTPDDLQLEWRPLYNLVERITEKSKSELGMYKYFSNLESTIDNLIHCCRFYFPVQATQEILDEIRPFFGPYQTEILSVAQYLESFLPLYCKPEEAHLGYKLWFEEIMSLWEVYQNANIWENSVMILIANLAECNVGYIDWDKYIPIMYVRFLRTLQLPVTYKQRKSGKQHKMDTAAIAQWIVCTLGPSEIAFYNLEKFMQTLESYFHSANNGRWSPKLRELLRRLAHSFVRRVHFERYAKPSWQLNTPQSHRLTDAHIERFVLLMRPCTEHAIFSTVLNSMDVRLALNDLASLRADLIVPGVLTRVYAAMDSLTEPHRLTSAVMSLVVVSRYMVLGAELNYPDGPTHVIPLLMALLPGIDPNDSRKSFVAFNLIGNLASMAPMVDSSAAANYYDDLTEEEHAVCEASAAYEDFVLQFVDRMCTFVVARSVEFVRHEQADDDMDAKSPAEKIAEGAVTIVVTTVLGQCSPRIFTAALRKVFNFATDRVLEAKVSGKLLALFCRAFSFVNPVNTLHMFVPHLCNTIKQLLADIDDKNDDNLNEELLYNLVLLAEGVDGRNHLIPYMDELISILDTLLHMKSLPGIKLGNKMLSLIMQSLSTIRPTEYCSLNQPISDDVRDCLTIREWGKAGDLENLKVSWFVPGKEEVGWVQQLVNRYLVPELEILTKYINGGTTSTREDLRRSFRIIISTLSASTVFPAWEEPQLKLIESSVDIEPIDLTTGIEHWVKLPDGRNVRKAIATTIHLVQKKILENDESDTKNLLLIVNIMELLLMNKQRCKYDARFRQFAQVKSMLQDYLRGPKKHLRHLLIDRAFLQLDLRLSLCNNAFTETHKMLLLDLFDLAVCRYSVIRVAAQTRIHKVIASTAFVYKILMPNIHEILKLDTTEHHDRFKGCLYVLLGPKSQSLIVRHEWESVKELWPLLIRSCPSEKPSIVNLMATAREQIHQSFPTISIDLEIPESCLNAAQFLANSKPKIHIDNIDVLTKNGSNVLKLTSERNRLNYNELITTVLQAAESGLLHWRYHEMAVSIMRDLPHADIHYSPEVVQFFFKALLHESIIIRKIAIRVCLMILIQNKLKYKKVTVDVSTLSGYSKEESANPALGIRADNKWLLYNSSKVPKTSGDWNKTRFVHSHVTGYYNWPKEFKLFDYESEQPCASNRLDNLTGNEQKIYDFFQSSENVALLVKYFKMEEKKGKDKFNRYRFAFFKNVFKIFGDIFLPVILPHLEILVNETEEESHRCAAEMIGGLIKGTKHWQFDKVEAMWTEVIPLIRTAFNNISEETVLDWTTGLAAGIEARDPNRCHWLLEFLIDEPLNEQSSFIASARLQILQMAIGQQHWRNQELVIRTMQYLKQHLSHPFQNVRDRISSCLTTLLTQNDRLSVDDKVLPVEGQTNVTQTSEFFKYVMGDLNLFYEACLKDGATALVSSSADKNKDIPHTINGLTIEMKQSDRLIRLYKVVAKYITSSTVHSSQASPADHYRLLPLATVLQTNEVDEELQSVSINLLAVLGYNPVLDRYIPKILDIVDEASQCRLWSSRAALAEFLPVLVFHNMATIQTRVEWVDRIIEIMLRLLNDPQPEVRTQAATLLSGLLHCRFIQEPLKLLELFKKKASIKKSAKRVDAVWLAQRHAAVLGCCAFIKAYPYDVPDFLPDIFNNLGKHLNDPQPIPATIRKTLGDFKRTHHDNWEVHKLKFTEEELTVLTDLTVPPSYYV